MIHRRHLLAAASLAPLAAALPARAVPLGAPRGGEADDTAALERAIAAAAAGDRLVSLPARTIRLSRTVFIPSGVTVRGAGSARTLVIFDSPAPPALRPAPRPLLGNVRTAAFAMAGDEPDADHAAYPAETGDYYISPPRRFAPDTALEPGDTRFDAADAAAVRDLAPGGWLQLMTGNTGWHPARSELRRIKAVAGRTVTLATPLKADYSNRPGGFDDFVQRFELTANPPGGTPLRRFAQTGFRRVRPVTGAALEGVTIRNVNEYQGYANLAYIMVRAIGCRTADIVSEGGGAWHIDSQDVNCAVKLRRARPAYARTEIFWNGSNDIRAHVEAIDSQVAIEEGVQRLRLTGFARQVDTNVQIQAFSSDITLENFDITNSTMFGLIVKNAARVRFSGRIVAAGVAFWYATPPLAKAHPGANGAAARYYDPSTIEVADAYLESTKNNSLELYLEQPVKARNVRLGGPNGGIHSIPAKAPGRVVGSAVKGPR